MSDQTEQPAAGAEDAAGGGGGDFRDLGPGWVSGNLTREPELRFTPNGRAVAHLRLADNPRWRNPVTGEWEDRPTVYHDVTVWGRMAENAAECLRKGDRVVAGGRWQERTYTQPDGAEVRRRQLVAADLGPSMLWRQAMVVVPNGAGGF